MEEKPDITLRHIRCGGVAMLGRRDTFIPMGQLHASDYWYPDGTRPVMGDLRTCHSCGCVIMGSFELEVAPI